MQSTIVISHCAGSGKSYALSQYFGDVLAAASAKKKKEKPNKRKR